MAEHDAHYLIIGSEQYNFRDDSKLPTASPSATGDLTVEGDIYFNEGADPLSTQLSGKANSADLANVATSGDYDDLLNKPTIPSDADDIAYDNTNSGLVAEDVQAAIDEVVTDLSDKMDKVDPVGTGSMQLSTTDTEISGERTVQDIDLPPIETGGGGSDDADVDISIQDVLSVALQTSPHRAVITEDKIVNSDADVFEVNPVKLLLRHYAELRHEYTEHGNDSYYTNIKHEFAGDIFFNNGITGLTAQLAAKQDALTAGTNITIAGDTISATDTKPTDYDTSGDKTDNVATGASWSILSSITVTQGKWIVSYGANFPSLGSGNTGHCGVGVSDVATPSTRPPVEACLTAQRITNDNYTTLSSSFLYDCTVSSKTLYLKVRQTSGQTLSVEGKLRVIKIL